jgi:hypothetical protein
MLLWEEQQAKAGHVPIFLQSDRAQKEDIPLVVLSITFCFAFSMSLLHGSLLGCDKEWFQVPTL